MNERSLGELRNDIHQTQPEAVARVAYDDLQPVVRNYVDNLTEQLRQMARKYRKKNLKELTLIVSKDEMSTEDVKKLDAISVAMKLAFQKNHLPKEMERDARLLRIQSLSRCMDAEKVYEDHLDQEDLQQTFPSDRIELLGVYLRLKRENPIKQSIADTLDSCQHAVSSAMAGDFSSMEEVFEKNDHRIESLKMIYEIVRIAIKQEKHDVVEQWIPETRLDAGRDGQIDYAILKLVQRKEFERAKKLVAYVFTEGKKPKLLEMIARGEVRAGKNWDKTIRSAEEALPALDGFSGALQKDQRIADIAVFYAEQGSVDDALRLYRTIHTDLRHKYVVRFVRALMSSGHDQQAVMIVESLEGSRLEFAQTNVRKIQAYVMIAVTQAEGGRNSDSAMNGALSILNHPVNSRWLHDVRVTSYIAYAHLMRGELKEMEDVLDQTIFTNQIKMNSNYGMEVIDLLEDFIFECRKRKIETDRPLKLMEQVIFETPSPDESFQALIDFAELLKDVGKDPTSVLEKARRINNQSDSDIEIYGSLQLADAYQKVGLDPSPIYDEVISVAERQQSTREAFEMLEVIANQKINNGLDFFDVTQSAYRFTTGKEMRDNPQEVWLHWYVFQMEVSAALLDKAEEIEKGLI